MQGSEPVHTNVIRAAFTPKVVDGGKARILARRDRMVYPSGLVSFDNLAMDHVDPALPLAALSLDED